MTLFKSLLQKMAIAIAGFGLCRLLFFALNANQFDNVVFWDWIIGARFDLSAFFMLYSPFLLLAIIPINSSWWNSIRNWTFHIINGLAIIANTIDIGFFPFTGKRLTGDFLSGNQFKTDVLAQIPIYLADFWFLVVFAVTLIYGSIWIDKRYNKEQSYQLNLNYVFQVVIIIVVTIVGIRGGVQMNPITIVSAAKQTDASKIPLVINTPFSMIKTIEKTALVEKNYFSKNQLNQKFNPIKKHKSLLPMRKKNVVVLIVESLSKEYIGALTGNKTYTPFLDSIVKQSISFTNCFANSKRSIEALPAIFCGLPKLMEEPVVTSNYAANEFTSLPKLLKEEGYSSAFFHGGKNGTMLFESFTQSIGFDRYVGKNEYNNDEHFDGNWGIFDHHFLPYSAKEMSRLKEPFISSVFTLSSHHPYTIPNSLENRFNKYDNKLKNSIAYADYSLQLFFEKAKEQDWFNNTVFIITADHTSSSQTPYYRSKAGKYAIPLIIYQPKKSKGKQLEKTCQQADIMSTTLKILRYKKQFYSFGNDVLSENSFSINYANNTYHYIEDNYLCMLANDSLQAIYYLPNDSLQRYNLVDSNRMAPIHVNNLKAIIQRYNSDMISNSLVAK